MSTPITCPLATSDGYSFQNTLAQAHRVETIKYDNGNTTARVVLRSGDVVKVRKLSDDELAKKVGAANHEIKKNTATSFVPEYEGIVSKLQKSLLNISVTSKMADKELTIEQILELPVIDWLSLHYAVSVLYS